jgi:exonuclease III
MCLTSIPHSYKYIGHPDKKINKEISKLDAIIDQRDLTDIYRIFHPTAIEHTLFSEAHRTFSKLCHVLGSKTDYF